METEDLAFNNCSHGKVIKEVSEVFPDIGVSILSETFIVESINLGDLS